ncbi:MAG: hypothetical protein QW647_02765 [Candidatus Bathyarchaeia archaeon]
MKKVFFSASLFIILVLISSLPSLASTTIVYTSSRREVSVNIKIVFIGFNEGMIDREYLTWNNPYYKYQSILIPGISTNVLYLFDYSYTIVNEDFKKEFLNYLHSIEIKEYKKNLIWNISYKIQKEVGLTVNYTEFKVNSLNSFYDAEKVEDWLIAHSESYDGLQENGYTLILSYLPELPSFTPEQFKAALKGENVTVTPHYYNKTFIDLDLGYKLNRCWMTAWGGKSRLYYIDLSAGPSLVDKQLPLQLAAEFNNIDLNSTYGKVWLNQYLSDYIYGAVYNLFAPDLIYPLNFSKKYVIDVLVLDNRSTNAKPDIKLTVNQNLIENSLKNLVPFANIEVKLRFNKLKDYPDFEEVVLQSTIKTRNFSDKYPPEPYYPPNIVDVRPIYEWLSESGKGHIKDFFKIKRSEEEFVIPVIIFAFTQDFNLGVSSKEWLAKKGVKDLWGIALYDMVLISHSEVDFNRGEYFGDENKGGFGFSQTIIHEVGHMLGLNHPFIYDETENYVNSVMSYYPYSYEFSQFDKDVLLRSLSDKFIMEAKTLISGTGKFKAGNLLTDAEQLYDKMFYKEALEKAYEALKDAKSLSFQLIPKTLIYAFVLGAAIGFTITYIFFKGKKSEIKYCAYCGRKLN